MPIRGSRVLSILCAYMHADMVGCTYARWSTCLATANVDGKIKRTC
jgi:hypothetical protein